MDPFFDDVTAIVFVAAVSEYDEVLFEDATMNRMAEALLLFESICNSRWFHSTLIILFLNKIDKLERKLAISPINRYFRDFSGDARNVDDAFTYFKTCFGTQQEPAPPHLCPSYMCHGYPDNEVCHCRSHRHDYPEISNGFRNDLIYIVEQLAYNSFENSKSEECGGYDHN